MIDIDDVIKEVQKNTGYDIKIVNAVCRHPFEYTKQIMKSKNDTLDILFNQLFKFKLKRRYKEDKNKEYKAK